MATILSKHIETDELGGGRNVGKFHIAPIAHLYQGYWRRNDPAFVDSGILGRPHLVTLAPFDVSIDDEGDRRIHLTKDPNVFVEVGTPYVRVGGVWQKVGFTSATRTVNKITWSRTQADLDIYHGGHFIKLGIELKGGYIPDNRQIAFPFTLQGLTRVGNQLYANGVPVMYMRPPHVEDLANPSALARPVAWDVVKLSGRHYILLTLPDLTGFERPYIDPTFTDGYGGDATTYKDTRVESGNPTNNYGVTDNIELGGESADQKRGLLQADVSSLAGMTITSAILSVYYQTDIIGANLDVDLHRLTQSWVEGTGNGSATGDGATWNTYDGVNNWATAGGDYAATAYDTQTFLDAGAGVRIEFDIADLVAEWVAGTYANNGVILRANPGAVNNQKRISTSDTGTTANRPYFQVDYSEGGAATARPKNRLALLGVA